MASISRCQRPLRADSQLRQHAVRGSDAAWQPGSGREGGERWCFSSCFAYNTGAMDAPRSPAGVVGTETATIETQTAENGAPPADGLAFPGCTAVHLLRADLETFERRLEYWDGATETAWICEPVSPYHEAPARALAALAASIAHVRRRTCGAASWSCTSRGASRGVGGGAGAADGEPAACGGTHDPRAGRRRLPGGGREPCVSRAASWQVVATYGRSAPRAVVLRLPPATDLTRSET